LLDVGREFEPWFARSIHTTLKVLQATGEPKAEATPVKEKKEEKKEKKPVLVCFFFNLIILLKRWISDRSYFSYHPNFV
jgi:hypothetical protein